MVGAFLAGRIAVWSGGRVFTSFDTFSYAYRDNPFYDRGPLVSFTGHAPRLWAAPLLYAALPDDTARAFAQWMIGTAAWAMLAWALWGCLRSAVARVVAAALVLALGLLPQVTNWDFAILSESLSISLGVLTLALFLRWAATGAWPFHNAMSYCAEFWVGSSSRCWPRYWPAVCVPGAG